jgi:hypothetical protein
MSINFGTSRKTTLSGTKTQPAKIGNTAFFAESILIVPLSLFPPSILRRIPIG